MKAVNLYVKTRSFAFSDPLINPDSRDSNQLSYEGVCLIALANIEQFLNSAKFFSTFFKKNV